MRKTQRESTATVSVRLLYAEARAALAQANRMARLTQAELAAAVDRLDVLTPQMGFVEVTEPLVYTAGALAQRHQLRGYDAVHLAAAQTVDEGDTVLVCGDRRLVAAAAREGLPTALTR